MFTSELEL